MSSNEMPVVSFEDVVQRFRIIHERPDTLREFFANVYRRGRSHYHNFEALKQISFEIFKGEVVGILGRNGSGKSTLLKTIAGVYTPNGGRVRVHGSVAPLIELGAGFHPELSGRENILLNGLLLGLSKQQILEKEQAIIDFADLGDFIDAPIKQYSSGMSARLGFAVATEVNPDILLLDEILSVGDGGFQQKCVARIRNFCKQGKTILFVSHSAAAIQELCSRALLLDHGILLEDGNTEYVLKKYSQLLGAAE